MTLPAALAPLAAYRRFVTYEAFPDPDRPGKTIKRPTDVRTGFYCNSNLPEHQYSYDEAQATGRPVGFVFNEADGFFFLDIDSAYQNGAWSLLATDLCGKLAGAAVEVSQSLTGLHIIGRGSVPPHACKNVILGLELYTHERFVALTSINAVGDASSDLSAPIAEIVASYFPHNPHGEIAGWTDAPVDGYGGPTDDADLLRVALKSGKNSAAANFGGVHVAFEDLWTANEEALSRRWPSDKGGYDQSNVDAALASHLAYWTGKNCERIRDLMFQSALVRPKWEERPDYVEITIMKACAVVKNVAQGKPQLEPVKPDIAAAAGVQLRTGHECLLPTEQLEYFAGCVYVVDLNKVWIPATGDLLDKARFDVVYAGHTFGMDPQNAKVTDSAYDAFTKSRIYEAPRADRICFRPECPPGAILHEEGRTLVNIYLPIETSRLQGDATPFLRLMGKILPVDRDREILFHYMASVVQNPGRKMQWWPVIQGAEGNGKSLIERAMAFSVGNRYSHLVNPDAMAKTGNQFNSWVMGNLWLGIEEIYVGAHRRDFLESFKTTVTNDRVPLEGKGMDQKTGDNRLNGAMFSNHPDAVPVTTDTRRYAIFYTAQQCADDLIRDGMDGGYFPDLYDWFYGRGVYLSNGPMFGARIINNWLRCYQLRAELDPAQMCVRAPQTSSTLAALQNSLGRAEQEVMEAVEQGRPGFAGGWISSLAVDRLLDEIRANIPRTKRRALLQSLGYDYHPHLVDGRVNNVVEPDHGKPRLYVKEGHLAAGLHEPAAIAKAYTNAQMSSTAGAAFPATEKTA